MEVNTSQALLSVENLQVEFKTRNGIAQVLDGIEFSLMPGETLGIVGESGCGKSMTALSIMGLVPQPPGRVAGGRITLSGEDLLFASDERMREIRGNEISMIFQEPMTSLNPVYSIGNQIAETVVLHQDLSRRDAWTKAVEMLKSVHIPEPEKRAKEYPHQLSGGMRQRAMIAMALACQPQVLIADEPTTALDVTVQAQVFDLLSELREQQGTAIVLITHDMGAIAEMADRVAVMYAGRIIEHGTVEQILEAPQHPYTQKLIECVPHVEDDPPLERKALTEIPGIVPALTDLGKGCAFEPRCLDRLSRCSSERPDVFAVSDGHMARCWLLEQATPQGAKRG